jgi:hypothetical protein
MRTQITKQLAKGLGIVAVTLAASGLHTGTANAQQLGSWLTPYNSGVTKPSSGSTFDWRSGNTYRWNRDSLGNTRINGSNLRTGSNWRTTIKPNGSMSGWDSKMNHWTHSRRSGVYQNFGTGRTCMGRGVARSCF